MKVISTLPHFFLIILLSVLSLQVIAENDATQSVNATVHINTANAEEISKALKGIGMKKAQAIVEYRENYGAFHHVDELTAVKGIGKNTLAKNVHLISLE